MSNPQNPSKIFELAHPWAHNTNPIWLASTLSLKRNLDKFNFPAKLPVERRKQVISLVGRDLPKKPAFTLFKGEELSPLEKEFLAEHFLLQESIQQAHQGEAFLIDGTGETLIGLNIQDHLGLHLIEIHGEIESAWSKLAKIEGALSQNLSYAYNPAFGYLTSDATEAGTGLQVTAFLQLPALLHGGSLGEILSRLADDSIQTRSLMGDPDTFAGDLVLVSNRYALGVNEENILSSLRGFVTKLQAEEVSARKQLKSADNPHVKDQVARAFGIMVHSYQLEAVEVLTEISLLKLGLELGWLKGLSADDLNLLFFNSRRAHLLQNQEEKKLNQEEIPHKRAEFIHSKLKNIELLI